MVIGIAQVPFVRRNVDILADELRRALASGGHPAEIVRLPFNGDCPHRTAEHALACRLMDWSASGGAFGDVLIALEFPLYLIQHPCKVLWLAHHHELEPVLEGAGTPASVGAGPAAHEEAARRALLEARRVFSVSATASHQLRKLAGITAVPVTPPPPAQERFHWEGTGDYLLVPAGVRPPGRLRLVFEALKRTCLPVRLRLCRVAGDPGWQEAVAGAEGMGLGSRVECAEGVPESELIELFARSRAILFPSREETFPWVTLQAMLASKPMLTCFDSGAPAEHVEHGVTGLCVEAHPECLAAAMDQLWTDPYRARVMGITARSVAENHPLGWPEVIARLLGPSPEERTHRIPEREREPVL